MGYEPTFFGVDGMDGILTLENFDMSLAEGVMVLTPFSADAINSSEDWLETDPFQIIIRIFASSFKRYINLPNPVFFYFFQHIPYLGAGPAARSQRLYPFRSFCRIYCLFICILLSWELLLTGICNPT